MCEEGGPKWNDPTEYHLFSTDPGLAELEHAYFNTLMTTLLTTLMTHASRLTKHGRSYPVDRTLLAPRESVDLGRTSTDQG